MFRKKITNVRLPCVSMRVSVRIRRIRVLPRSGNWSSTGQGKSTGVPSLSARRRNLTVPMLGGLWRCYEDVEHTEKGRL